MSAVFKDVREELARAREAYPHWHSPHEGYAALLEEVDELWERVREAKYTRGVACFNRGEMRVECVQIAAMAVRFIEDLIDE